MPSKAELIHSVIRGETRQERVRSLAALVMWFSVGALVFSAIFDHSVTVDAAGGALSAISAAFFKLT